MALVSENPVSGLTNIGKGRTISFCETLETRHHNDDDSDFGDSDEDEDDDTSPTKDPETAEMASLERKALRYRKSLTMLNQFASLKLGGEGPLVAAAAGGAKMQPSKEHLLAAKKSMDDLTAWVNAGALEGDDDPFGGDDN
ncbi:hypothetical protein BGZ59_008355 [Podila verticillata]|uniref:Uncharacterized protein n=1 Tax=Podila verticillata NRRL 6337 TaxID=1069443 RepID=A0A086TLG4_9FUNG|nr:hypothetical protein BGZ59_008355 [Podila verticillata]KFH62791.1 hypothetical protein MVEG_11317 [Podila verticillata NRRL 6337]